MHTGTLIKWDANIVGEQPPLYANGRLYKPMGRVRQFLHRALLKFGIDINPGQPFDPANTAGVLEIIEIGDTGHVVTYRRS